MSNVNVLTAARTLELLGETIIGASIVGNDLILTTRSGATINAGNVRGASAANPTALATAFSPAGGIAASNVQSAIVELAGDATALSTAKADKTALPKVLSGRVTQPSTANTKVTFAHTNVFPAGYFSSAPDIVITPDSTVPENLWYYSVTARTTTGFSIVSYRTSSSNTAYSWIAMG